ncbi:MAG: hypothetical protein CVU39_06390 [Chloroflexi bacterium HGW-Chloroflexi-10]|nr:MAG: hypothetical protein CVU39_06390 [Chloroflexi bacterium HGW-Chloroflexi-10]
MDKHTQYMQVRTKKLGLLIYDARLSTGKTLEECAQITGIAVSRLESFEKGQVSPTLPEIEVLAYSLKIPMEHFWGKQIISQTKQPDQAKKFQQLLIIRQRLIGANIKKIRTDKGISLEDIAQNNHVDTEVFRQFEYGEKEIPLPQLELIAKFLKCRVEDFFDTQGVISNWRKEQQQLRDLTGLPAAIREFVTKPVNIPYIELALRLSELDVQKLRLVAEGLLEITY